MFNAKQMIGALLAIIMALIFSAEVLAQFPGGGMGGSRSSRGGFGGRESGRGTIQAPREANNGDTAELIEYRLGMLEEDLKMSPAQLRSWEPFANGVRAAGADIVRERNVAKSIGTPTAMQQLTRATDIARDRLTALEDIGTAMKAFYGNLSPEQKMLVDARAQSIFSLLAGGSTQSPPPDAGGGRRPAREDGGFTPPSRPLP
jgi:hypothetical protein